MIETGPMESWKQFISILAGPAGSLSLILLGRAAPKIAIFGLLQGLLNLIPVLPLDGGRLFRLVLDWICPYRADFFMDAAAMVVWGVFSGAIVWFGLLSSFRPWLLLTGMVWLIRFLPRKIPCKQA